METRLNITGRSRKEWAQAISEIPSSMWTVSHRDQSSYSVQTMSYASLCGSVVVRLFFNRLPSDIKVYYKNRNGDDWVLGEFVACVGDPAWQVLCGLINRVLGFKDELEPDRHLATFKKHVADISKDSSGDHAKLVKQIMNKEKMTCPRCGSKSLIRSARLNNETQGAGLYIESVTCPDCDKVWNIEYAPSRITVDGITAKV